MNSGSISTAIRAEPQESSGASELGISAIHCSFSLPLSVFSFILSEGYTFMLTISGLQIHLLLISALICGISMPVLIKLAPSLRLMDHPTSRKLHEYARPSIGGIGILLGVLVSFFWIPAPSRFWASYLFAIAIISVLGLVDDLFDLSPFIKLAVQIAATILLVLGTDLRISVGFENLQILNTPVLSFLTTCFWIVGITNSVNLTDGMDGLAGGISFYSFGALALVGFQKGLLTYSLMAAAFMGATLGFLLYNLPRAKTFMGNQGSLLLGFNIGFLSISIPMKTGTAFSVILPILFVAIPVFDTFLAIFRRLKKGQNPFAPDREHMHHKLLNLNFSDKQIILAFYLVSLALSLLAISATNVGILRTLVLVLLILYSFLAIAYVMKRQHFENEVQKFNHSMLMLQEKIKDMAFFKKPQDQHIVHFMMKITILLLILSFFPSGPYTYERFLIGSLVVAFFVVSHIASELQGNGKFVSGFAYFWMYFFLFYHMLHTVVQPLLMIAVLAIALPLVFYSIFVKRYLNIFFPEPIEPLIVFSLVLIYKSHLTDPSRFFISAGLASIIYLLYKGTCKNDLNTTKTLQFIHVLIAMMIPLYLYFGYSNPIQNHTRKPATQKVKTVSQINNYSSEMLQFLQTRCSISVDD